MEDLRDKIFQTHNEITIRDGRTFYVIDGYMAVGKNLMWVGYAEYDYELNSNSGEFNCYDIIKVYNPITKEVVYNRDDVDWSKVKVDTPIIVHGLFSDEWKKRYFAKFENNKVYAFPNGCTSWSTENCESPIDWRYAKLADK